MKRVTRISLVFLAAAVLLGGCAFNRNSLIGTWNEVSSQQTLIFTVDSKIIFSNSDGARAEVGYQFVDDESIYIPVYQDLFTYEITGDQMTLSGQSQTIQLTRVK